MEQVRSGARAFVLLATFGWLARSLWRPAAPQAAATVESSS